MFFPKHAYLVNIFWRLLLGNSEYWRKNSRRYYHVSINMDVLKKKEKKSKWNTLKNISSRLFRMSFRNDIPYITTFIVKSYDFWTIECFFIFITFSISHKRCLCVYMELFRVYHYTRSLLKYNNVSLVSRPSTT